MVWNKWVISLIFLLLETLYNSSTLCLFWLQRLSRLKQILGPKWQKVSTDYLVVWGSDISISFPFNPSESSSTPAANVKIFNFHAYSARTGQCYIRTLQTTRSRLQLWVQPLRVCGGLTTGRQAALAHQVPPIILREKKDTRQLFMPNEDACWCGIGMIHSPRCTLNTEVS